MDQLRHVAEGGVLGRVLVVLVLKKKLLAKLFKSNQIEFSNCPRLVPEYGNVAGELPHVEEEG